MNITEIALQDVIPRFMRGDKTVEGLCAAANVIFTEIIKRLPLVNLKTDLKLITEEDLDYIAKIEKISWYDTAYTREQKENIISNFEKNCFYLGTKTAVQNVTMEIFGENEVKEWFEYEGEEKHFSVRTNFIGDIRKAVSEYEKRIEDVKSFRALMDDVVFLKSTAMHQTISGKIIQREQVFIKEGNNGGI